MIDTYYFVNETWDLQISIHYIRKKTEKEPLRQTLKTPRF